MRLLGVLYSGEKEIYNIFFRSIINVILYALSSGNAFLSVNATVMFAPRNSVLESLVLLESNRAFASAAPVTVSLQRFFSDPSGLDATLVLPRLMFSDTRHSRKRPASPLLIYAPEVPLFHFLEPTNPSQFTTTHFSTLFLDCTAAALLVQPPHHGARNQFPPRQ